MNRKHKSSWIWLWRLLLLITLLSRPATVGASEVWLAGVDPVSRAILFPKSPSDYLQMFRSDAPWQTASKHVKVLQTTAGFLLKASDSDLRNFFADLKRRDIALGIEALILSGRNGCGVRVEGYSSASSMESMAQRVRTLGGDLQYLTMDAPLQNGHYYSGPNACRSSLEELGQDVATKVGTLHRYFPNLKVGDTEPFPIEDRPDWVDVVMQWARTYEISVGKPLAWVHADVAWYGSWDEQLKQLAPRLRAAGIELGVIYNGNPTDPTDETWTRHAEERFAAVETGTSLVPEQAILQTWMFRPEHMLPETLPGTLTYLVNRYAAVPTRLAMRREGQRLAGQLTDSNGRPIGDATIQVSAVDNGKAGVEVIRRIAGKVPEGAATAVLSLRINTSCRCRRTANVAIGTMRYRDEDTGDEFQRNFHFPPGRISAGRIVARTTDNISANAEAIRVSAGAKYSVQIPVQISYASVGSGRISLNFLDAQGKQIDAQQILFDASERAVGNVVTDVLGGRFSLDVAAGIGGSMPSYRAEFVGDPTHRQSSMLVP